MSRLASGDRDAARAVFDLLWPRVHGFCARALGDSNQADDVAQRSLVHLFGKASAFDPERDALAWALEIALWECRTELRRRSRSREASWDEAHLERVAEMGASPEVALQQRELRDALESVVAALGPNDRETLLALLSEDLPPVPPATWRKRKERALMRFRLMWRTLHGSD